ncbi:hypothetical protein LOK46_06715 [Methylobacterium sp. NMS14P]|uniref:hypothetical protein n=1 Tax=Methylobacterium sp. NMS14P TaxID=2894310 RepID=UPI0023591AA7|nr:hypothetical protein [Methylobacterium sp. NMS14P]WCS26525.1 hypothetical protein LOK46_06715 [Methylobacterium sp. NMS14P]
MLDAVAHFLDASLHRRSGDFGGLFGGKLNLGGLLGGGSSNEAGAPLPGAQGPSPPTAGMFGNLFNTDKIASALGLGAETGLGSAVSGWLKESRQGGGILTSPLGQGLTSIAAGGAVGYSSQSPLLGGVSGLLAGAMTGNPLLAAAGRHCRHRGRRLRPQTHSEEGSRS